MNILKKTKEWTPLYIENNTLVDENGIINASDIEYFKNYTNLKVFKEHDFFTYFNNNDFNLYIHILRNINFFTYNGSLLFVENFSVQFADFGLILAKNKEGVVKILVNEIFYEKYKQYLYKGIKQLGYSKKDFVFLTSDEIKQFKTPFTIPVRNLSDNGRKSIINNFKEYLKLFIFKNKEVCQTEKQETF